MKRVLQAAALAAIIGVASILAQVGSDAVGAGRFTNQRGVDRVRFALSTAAIPSFAQRGNVIDIDAELQHEKS